MKLEAITYQPIGMVHTPHKTPQGAPIQPTGARGAVGRAVLKPELAPGLKDLAGFSHVILLYHCHLAGQANLEVKPFLDAEPHGVFATRAPARPNALGLSVVRLKGVEDNVLLLEDVDLLDGTPLLDIKPYVPDFDQPPGPVKTGWLAGRAADAGTAKGDQRFE